MFTKVKYVRQRDHYSCGPVAVLNILKWLGVKATYKGAIPALQIMCKCKEDVGTGRGDIERALKKLRIKKKRRVCPSLKEIDAHLDSGGIILLEYFYTKFDGHFSICIDRTTTHYVLVNDSVRETITKRSRQELKNLIKRHRTNEHPWVWFIYR